MGRRKLVCARGERLDWQCAADTHIHTDGAYAYLYSNANRYTNANRDWYCNQHPIAYGDAHRYSNVHSNVHSYGNVHSNGDTDGYPYPITD